MSVLFRQLSWHRATRMLGLLLVLWGGGIAAYGQVNEDTTGRSTQRDVRDTPPAPLDSVRTEDVTAADTSAPEKAIVRADSLSAMVREGERLQELFNDVKVRQDTTRLRSNYALRYLERDELLFTGDVVIYERGDTLRADTVWYNKKTKVGRARSNVRLTDGKVLVRAPKAIYYTEEKRAVFPDSVTLVDSNRVLQAQRGTYWSNDRRAEFSGEVRLTDPNTYLEADSLTYFRDQERSIATGSVFIRRVETEKGETPDTTSVAADTTSGTVDTTSVIPDTASVAADTTSITYLFGEWADNQEQNRYSRVERRALLVRVRMDSTGAPDDTLAVRAHRLEAKRTDTYHRLVAVDSVRIWQANLAAVADSAVYDRVVGVGAPDTTAAPSPLPDTTTAPPVDSAKTYDSRLDSLVAQTELVETASHGLPPAPPKTTPPSEAPDTTQTLAPSDTTHPPDTTRLADASLPDTTRGPVPQGRPAPDSVAAADTSRAPGRRAQKRQRVQNRWKTPSVQSEDDLPLEETRLFRNPVAWFERSQVWGDSIRVRARNRSLDTVYVRGSAFASQKDTTVDRIRQLKGKNITAFFHRDSLRRIRARPNGQAIYFSASEKGTLNGATRASADYVKLYFRRGEVERIKFGSGVQGTAYHKKKYIPDPFRLDGFRWTPERRPTRVGLLREKRVRDRLDLGPLPQPSEGRAPPIARAPADSVAQRSGGRQGGDASQTALQSRSASDGQGNRRPPRSDSLAVPVDSGQTDSEPRTPTAPSDSTKSPTLNP